MDTTVTHQSKPQWRFNRPHRVRLFVWRSHISEALKHSTQDMYMQAATLFSETEQYKWAERNNIKLDFDIDERSQDWFKQIRFYADLDEVQYTDYCLRFFDHHNEEWK